MNRHARTLGLDWQNLVPQSQVRFKCGYCGTDTTPSSGWHTTQDDYGVRAYCLICTYCNKPSFVLTKNYFLLESTPAAMMGNDIQGLPPDIDLLYNEARRATGSGAYTAAVLTCRKILMHVAVGKGALPGQNFMEYVKFLDTNGIIPRDAKGWVDHIRTKSNEANHEIMIMSQQDADQLISFTEMLLRLTYEFLHRLPKSTEKAEEE